MVTVDHNKNINRIISRIKADSNSFDPDTDGKLRAVVFGNPANREEKAFPLKPYVYVTTKESIQRTSYPFGISSGNAIPSVTVEYKISVVATSKAKTQESEKLQYDLLKNLRTTLTTDPTFKTTDPTPIDPIFTRSVLNQVPWEQDTIGQLVTTIDFILLATIGSIGTIKIAGINDGKEIEIISEAPDSEIESFSPQRNDQLLVKGFAPTGSIRSKSVEIDHINSITEELRTKKRLRKTFTLTMKDIDGTPTDYTSIISQLTSNISKIDGIKTDLIQFLIVP